MEVLLEVMLRARDKGTEQLHLYEESSDKCKLSNEYEFIFTGGWVEALNYMIEVAESLLSGDEEGI